jgi:hypothetical protein
MVFVNISTQVGEEHQGGFSCNRNACSMFTTNSICKEQKNLVFMTFDYRRQQLIRATLLVAVIIHVIRLLVALLISLAHD